MVARFTISGVFSSIQNWNKATLPNAATYRRGVWYLSRLVATLSTGLRFAPHVLYRLLDAAAEALFQEGVAEVLRPYPSVTM